MRKYILVSSLYQVLIIAIMPGLYFGIELDMYISDMSPVTRQLPQNCSLQKEQICGHDNYDKGDF